MYKAVGGGAGGWGGCNIADLYLIFLKYPMKMKMTKLFHLYWIFKSFIGYLKGGGGQEVVSSKPPGPPLDPPLNGWHCIVLRLNFNFRIYSVIIRTVSNLITLFLGKLLSRLPVFSVSYFHQ